MAYCIETSDRSAEAALRRIAVELARKAVSGADALAGQSRQDEPTLHELRVACKKLRALLRLVRRGLDGFHEENAAIRDAGRKLASARDAHVALATMDALLKGHAGLPPDVAAFRADLEARCEAPANALPAAALGEFRDALAAVGKRARGWSPRGRGFDAFAGGLRASYRQGRRAMRAARRHPDPEHFHQWRKRVKDHWYHARILAPIWPEIIGPHAALAGDLGDMLGIHHDLVVFRALLAEAPISKEEKATLDERAIARMRQLAEQSHELGQRLFAEPPACLAKRWRSYWECWRADKKARSRNESGSGRRPQINARRGRHPPG